MVYIILLLMAYDVNTPKDCWQPEPTAYIIIEQGKPQWIGLDLHILCCINFTSTSLSLEGIHRRH